MAEKTLPPVLQMDRKNPPETATIITWILIIFMLANILVSTLALTRYDQRAHNEPAANAIEQLIDERFPDSRMEKIYPNAKMAS